MNFHLFSRSEQVINSKRHIKRSLCIKFEENRLSLLIFRESLMMKHKTCLPCLDFHQFFCNERLLRSKRHPNGNFYVVVEGNRSSRFLFREPLTKHKICLPCLDFHPFLCSEGLLHPKRHPNENFYVTFEENRSSCFFEIRSSESQNWTTRFGFPSI